MAQAAFCGLAGSVVSVRFIPGAADGENQAERRADAALLAHQKITLSSDAAEIAPATTAIASLSASIAPLSATESAKSTAITSATSYTQQILGSKVLLINIIGKTYK